MPVRVARQPTLAPMPMPILAGLDSFDVLGGESFWAGALWVGGGRLDVVSAIVLVRLVIASLVDDRSLMGLPPSRVVVLSRCAVLISLAASVGDGPLVLEDELDLLLVEVLEGVAEGV